MPADRRTKERADQVDRRVTLGRVMTAVAVLSRRRPPSLRDVLRELPDLSHGAVLSALNDLVVRRMLAAEEEPAELLPLLNPRLVRYRPLALAAGSSLPEGGGR